MLLWEQRHWLGAPTAFFDLAVLPSGGIVVVGRIVPPEEEAMILAARCDPAGNVLWTDRQAGTEGRDPTAYGVAAAPDGSFVVVGSIDRGSPGHQHWNLFATRYRGDNSIAWAIEYDGPGGGDDAALDVALAPNLDPIVVGYVETADSRADIWVTRYAWEP